MIRDRVPAYISWDRFLANRARLRANDVRGDRGGPPRSGMALLTGLVTCGACGWRLRTSHPQSATPYYLCIRHRETGESRTCHGIPARCVDPLVADLILKAIEPAALTAGLRACEAVDRDREKVLTVRRQAVERSRYEADRAGRQFHAVEPENRLVARSLEQEWEASLRDVRNAEMEYGRAEQTQPLPLTDADRDRVLRLATDVPALWDAATTTPTDRKTVVRTLIERVIVFARSGTERVRVTIRWRGGFTTDHEGTRPVAEYRHLEGYAAMKERMIGWRREGLTSEQIATRLNDEGTKPPKHAGQYTKDGVRTLLSRWGVSSAAAAVGPLRPGEWWLPDLTQELDLDDRKLRMWVKRGWVHARRASGRWVAWADADELNRLRLLRDRSRHGEKHYPTGLTQPKTKAKM